jgi:hypothetical protein
MYVFLYIQIQNSVCVSGNDPLPPENDEHSTAYGSTIHTITSPPHPILHPVLGLTQGPPPPVAASTAELIGDNTTLVRLSYTLQGQCY